MSIRMRLIDVQYPSQCNTRETLEEQIKRVFYFDNDFIGENGQAYTSKEAISNGFANDLDYSISKAKSDLGMSEIKEEKVEDVIESMLQYLLKINGTYYKDIIVDFLPITEGLAVAVAIEE